ncbi:MAG: VWA domain-containing protein [Chloroflexi bacterium]|nr:VWA domain-containing protein [Chloroflexota bacterium]
MNNQNHKILLVGILIASVLFNACVKDQPTTDQPGNAVSLQITQIDTSQFPLVNVYISAKDVTGNPVPVPANDIELLEDGFPVDKKSIQGMDNVESFTSLLLIDNSGSMNFSNKLETAKSAASSYVEQMRSSDSAGIITFNTQVQTVQGITSDKETLLAGIAGIRAQGDTAMWDALLKAIGTLNPLAGRKAIILLTDGMDNQSQNSSDEILQAIGASGLSISTIGFGTQPSENENPDEYEGIDENTLRNLAQNAGGIYGYVQDAQELVGLYTNIRQSLQSEVMVSYITPQSLRDGVLRSLSVHLRGAWQNNVSGTVSSYNPGGLIPEVPDTSNWLLFGVLLGILILAILIPMSITRYLNKKKRKKIRIILKD